jgi:hypothetical protein
MIADEKPIVNLIFINCKLSPNVSAVRGSWSVVRVLPKMRVLPAGPYLFRYGSLKFNNVRYYRMSFRQRTFYMKGTKKLPLLTYFIDPIFAENGSLLIQILIFIPWRCPSFLDPHLSSVVRRLSSVACGLLSLSRSCLTHTKEC